MVRVLDKVDFESLDTRCSSPRVVIRYVESGIGDLIVHLDDHTKPGRRELVRQTSADGACVGVGKTLDPLIDAFDLLLIKFKHLVAAMRDRSDPLARHPAPS